MHPSVSNKITTSCKSHSNLNHPFLGISPHSIYYPPNEWKTISTLTLCIRLTLEWKVHLTPRVVLCVWVSSVRVWMCVCSVEREREGFLGTHCWYTFQMVTLSCREREWDNVTHIFVGSIFGWYSMVDETFMGKHHWPMRENLYLSTLGLYSVWCQSCLTQINGELLLFAWKLFYSLFIWKWQ